jgi:hypothetical protein
LHSCWILPQQLLCGARRERDAEHSLRNRIVQIAGQALPFLERYFLSRSPQQSSVLGR